MILYEVTDSKGELIMTAPLTTISLVFDLSHEAQARVERETVKLNGKCQCLLWRPDWEMINIRRLPLEIPSNMLTRRQAS